MENKLTKMIKRNEGLRLTPYRCSAGKLTIGYGRNLEDNGITNYEAEVLLAKDINDARESARLFVSEIFKTLSLNRQNALIDMALNLGLPRLSQFVKLKSAIIKGDFDKAAAEMLDSKWAKQVGYRAIDDAELMKKG